ncbi:NAD-dependent epimerase/dehydratase family protein [Candidatus Saccharibacteria bacterium]|nr:NAD-dependent epimerase/dehydratase family protein [Candidatus Saccharibacteria bacterium]
MTKTVLITGSAGLIGSEAVRYFAEKEFKVIGIDNNSRKYFFGDAASTDWNRSRLEKNHKNYTHHAVDIRDEGKIEEIFKNNDISLVIHTAAQPSHDWAAKEPLTDFTINSVGTLIMLEATRKHAPDAVFIFTSTNKVYGDNPNLLPLIETETRFELPKDHEYFNGIDENMSLDQCTHSIFGVSKVAADLMVQEYGKYFGMKTGVFRGGCLTGPAHSSAQLHGFLAYLVSAIATGQPYTIFGYKGKQVRDNIHAHDVIEAFNQFYENPRPGEVYNIGGSRHSNTSVLEAISVSEEILGKKAKFTYDETNRIGDHIWYISGVSKFKNHYPQWDYTYDNQKIIEELCRSAIKKSLNGRNK